MLGFFQDFFGVMGGFIRSNGSVRGPATGPRNGAPCSPRARMRAFPQHLRAKACAGTARCHGHLPLAGSASRFGEGKRASDSWSRLSPMATALPQNPPRFLVPFLPHVVECCGRVPFGPPFLSLFRSSPMSAILRSDLSLLSERAAAALRAVDDALAHSLARIDARCVHGESTADAFQDAAQVAVRVPKVRVLVGEARLAIAAALQHLDASTDDCAEERAHARDRKDDARACVQSAEREVRQARLWAGLDKPRAASADIGGGDLDYNPEA